jgi:hypothetical protein
VAICGLVTKEKQWIGTASELLEVLTQFVPIPTQQSRNWPQSARVLSNQMRRVTTFLRSVGVEVQFYREAHTGKRLIKIEKVGKPSSGDDGDAK